MTTLEFLNVGLWISTGLYLQGGQGVQPPCLRCLTNDIRYTQQVQGGSILTLPLSTLPDVNSAL